MAAEALGVVLRTALVAALVAAARVADGAPNEVAARHARAADPAAALSGVGRASQAWLARTAGPALASAALRSRLMAAVALTRRAGTAGPVLAALHVVAAVRGLMAARRPVVTVPAARRATGGFASMRALGRVRAAASPAGGQAPWRPSAHQPGIGSAVP